MTVNFWTEWWFYWLALVALSWFVLENLSILDAHLAGDRSIMDWTLSDTIRRWSVAHRWLAPVSAGTSAFLLWHFFIERNAA